MKFRFVFVSKDDKFGMPAGTVPFDTTYISNNKGKLSEVYNEALKSDRDSDFVFLSHADVKFDAKGLAVQVEALGGRYDVIGLCGCSQFSVGASPLNWYTGSAHAPEGRWGCVTHGELGGHTTFFSAHHPDVEDHEVACVDGLCIGISRNALSRGLLFDESLPPFDFYDTDLSMQAVLKLGLRLGVVVRKELQHWSVGKSILTPEFKAEEDLFRSKWGFQRRPAAVMR